MDSQNCKCTSGASCSCGDSCKCENCQCKPCKKTKSHACCSDSHSSQKTGSCPCAPDQGSKCSQGCQCEKGCEACSCCK
ncbi:metallothionein-like [Hyperolius riggenbachi]|uniref:metallothionein-like n=1 Tax=Hyperolius riggenbachi TaxID=752182 RepID=UPI0035A272A1